LPGENPDEFETFRDGLLNNLDPQGELEGVLAEKIVTDAWRLRRVTIFEATLHNRGSAELLTSEAEESVRQYESTNAEMMSAVANKKFVLAKDRQAHEDAQQKPALSRAELRNRSFNMTRVLERYPALFLNLWRHEDVISRSMLRTLHKLERLQAKRAGEDVSVPAVVDVDVSVSETGAAIS
jgi:hypothetical protein